MTAVKAVNYVNGQWVEPDKPAYSDIENPSTGASLGSVALSGTADVDRAVSAAREAFGSWSSTPVTQRTTYLHRLLSLLQDNGEEIARCLTEEMGKSLPDARAEMKRVYQNIEVASAAAMLQQGRKLVGCAGGIDGEVLPLPVGVFAAITPFNFPAMAPFWFIPYAIATGNTFILKPSELVPLTMELITRYVEKTGLPPGVFNLVNGDKAAAVALVEHPGISGVSFVGRSETCRVIAQRCAALGKRYQAMGSAKNHLVVMPDYTHMDELIRNMSTSCYGCAGQRCMASSAIVVVGDEMYDKVCDQFVADSRKFIVADPLDPEMSSESMLMGPVISAQSKQFILDTIETGVQEGADLVLDGRSIEIAGAEKGYFVGPTVFKDVKPGMAVHKTEIFGPVVCIMKAESLDEAIEIINNHQYSNACSIYTKSGYYARKFKLGVKTGMVGVNVGIPAPVPFLPFGGTDNSMHCDIKMQGESAFRFFTENKVVVERYWEET